MIHSHRCFPMGHPGFKPRLGHVGFVVDKAALRQVSPSTLVSPDTSHSADYSTLIISNCHPGLVHQAKSWSTHQVDSVSPHSKKQQKQKKKQAWYCDSCWKYATLNMVPMFVNVHRFRVLFWSMAEIFILTVEDKFIQKLFQVKEDRWRYTVLPINFK
jgi:hypothetical protein